MNFDNRMHYDLMIGLQMFPVSFDFALLTLTVFNTLRISTPEKIEIHLVESLNGTSQMSIVKSVTYVKLKT